MSEDQMREPSARLAQARAFLALQDFNQVDDLTYRGRYYNATIQTDKPTQEPRGWGCKPSYVILYEAAA